MKVPDEQIQTRVKVNNTPLCNRFSADVTFSILRLGWPIKRKVNPGEGVHFFQSFTTIKNRGIWSILELRISLNDKPICANLTSSCYRHMYKLLFMEEKIW